VLVREVTDDRLRCDVDLTDDRGRVIARFTGWEDVRIELPARLRDFLGCPSGAFLSEPCAGPTDSGGLIRRRRLDDLPAVVQDYGGLWLDVLAHCVLAESERGPWRRLADAPASERADWLASRVAAKEAVRELLADQGEPHWADCDVVVCTGRDGDPVVAEPALSDGAVPVLSITRDDGVVVAAAMHPQSVADADRNVGDAGRTPSGTTGSLSAS
jgi:hypothetical protein